MIIINSGEKLLSSAIRNRLQETYPGIQLVFSKGLHHEWKKDATHAVDKVDKVDKAIDKGHSADKGHSHYPFVQCFVINDFPFNVYDIYEQMKSLLKEMGSLKMKSASIHVIIKLNMDDIRVAGNIRSHFRHLQTLVSDITRHMDYRLRTHFSCTYNVFGMVDATLLQTDSNNVQRLLSLLKNPKKELVVPFGLVEEVIGTDVHEAVSQILEKSDGDNDEECTFLSVSPSISATSLIEKVSRHYPDRYHHIRFAADPDGSGERSGDKVKSEFKVADHSRTVVDSFIHYLG